MTDRPLPFSLDWLAGAALKLQRDDVTACDEGHMLVRGRSCWAPTRFSEDLRALWCVPVEHELTRP